MVAREYCSPQLFSMLCQMACSVANAMGLQRIPGGSASSYFPHSTERASLFWTLYILDKQRVFMSGVPCDLYLFDSDVRLLEQESGYTLPHYRTALIHVMSIWEDIHISLYSSRIRRERTSQVDHQVSRLNKRLDAWAHQHKDLLNDALVLGSFSPYLGQELKYVFHVAKILVYRCSNTETNKERRMANASSALGIINDMHNPTPSLRGAALLRR